MFADELMECWIDVDKKWVNARCPTRGGKIRICQIVFRLLQDELVPKEFSVGFNFTEDITMLENRLRCYFERLRFPKEWSLPDGVVSSYKLIIEEMPTARPDEPAATFLRQNQMPATVR